MTSQEPSNVNNSFDADRFYDASQIKHPNLKAYYDKLRPFRYYDQKDPRCSIRKLMQKVEFSSDEAYLWGAKLDDSKKDDMDVNFENLISPVKNGSVVGPKVVLGLHNYGGYWAFFRPDIEEACKLLTLLVKEEELVKYDRIYVTTTAIGDGSVSSCYDKELDKHRAYNIFYLVPV